MWSAGLAEFKNSLITPLVPVNSRHRVECLWFFDVKATPEQLWPYMSDTSRMNRDLGLSPWKEETIDGIMHVESVSLGRTEKWIEKPWIWVEPKEIQNHRVFSQGWMTEQRGVFTITPVSENLSRVAVYFQWGFSSLWVKWLFEIASGVLKQKFTDFLKRTESVIHGAQRYQAAKERTPVLADSKNRIEEILKNISSDETARNSETENLLTYLLTADEMDLDKVRVKAVSDKLKTSLPAVLKSAHTFVEHGYLYLAWDLVCPHCRGAVASEKNLADISGVNNCNTCDIEFGIEQEESVEVVFHLTSKLRSINTQEYCAAEPAKKKHIKMFQVLHPQQQREIRLQLKPGQYRIRNSRNKLYFSIEVVSEGGMAQALWSSEIAVAESVKVSPEFTLTLKNAGDEPNSVTLEEAWWINDRLLPGEILSYPEFRKFFSNDHLSAGVKLYLGNQVLLFTDIVGSTPLYQELGDAKAFEAVRRHYGEITQGVAESRGVLIKFIGDAVMAAFLDLEDAFKAAVRIQKRFADQQIKIRISMNYGPVLCANLNVGLDYFGTTVNTAAKIQKWGGSHQIVTTLSIWNAVKDKCGAGVSLVESKKDEKLGVDVVVLTVD